MLINILRWIFTGVFLVLVTSPALAHPHVWIDAQTIVRFDLQGRVLGLTHRWKFDEAFSAWAVQGMGVNGDGVLSFEEMQELAHEQVSGLAAYDFFTFAGEGQQDFALFSRTPPKMENQDGLLTLVFEVDFDEAYQISNVLEIAIFDPEYYVAIDFFDETPVILEGAPESCSFDISPPVTPDRETEAKLLELGPEVTQLPPELKALLRDAGNTIEVRCGPQQVETARTGVEAINQLVGVRAPPFLAPPAEAGLPVPRGGLLGWVYQRQIEFYQALTGALSQLKSDNSAFWVLGGLSFLYGIFHAAGPGHGKVVISSYVLASESEVWRGVVMSFAAAMVQSSVAVIFVLIGAQILNLTSSVMSNVANWFAIGSYGFVVLLGVWLVAKKLFGIGKHTHAQGARVHTGHSHENHDANGCGHHHMVTPAQTGGSWRDAAGVVLAVGMRPCSGALVVLVFALSQGVLLAGIGATYLMGIGTALTVAVLASLALVIKEYLGKLGGRKSSLAKRIMGGVELIGAFGVLGFGLVLLIASFG